MTHDPNLFEFAPNELSQDAVLAWLLKWADVRHRGPIHDAGRALLCALARDQEVGEHVVVRRQWKRIDLVIEVSAADQERPSLAIAIEDKVHSGAKPRPGGRTALEDYAEVLRDHYSGCNLVHLYVKTGDEPETQLASPWIRICRRDLLTALRPHREASDTLKDFVDWLDKRERAVGAWASNAPVEWDVDAWKGFFEHTRVHGLDDAGWGYVPNARGGFFGLWWPCLGPLYLQLEVRPNPDRPQYPWSRPLPVLCLRMGGGQPIDEALLQRLWTDASIPLVRPKRMRRGRTFAVAETRDQGWLPAEGQALAGLLSKITAGVRGLGAVR